MGLQVNKVPSCEEIDRDSDPGQFGPVIGAQGARSDDYSPRMIGKGDLGAGTHPLTIADSSVHPSPGQSILENAGLSFLAGDGRWFSWVHSSTVRAGDS